MVSVSLAVVFLTGFAMFGGIVFIPLFFQGVLGWFSGGLAVTGGFAVGFWVGFRLG